jgi:hypothetical protein
MWRDLWWRRVSKTLSFNQLLQKPKTALLIIKFILKIGLLPQFQGVDPVATGLIQDNSNKLELGY